jgi:hypothetical protein
MLERDKVDSQDGWPENVRAVVEEDALHHRRPTHDDFR